MLEDKDKKYAFIKKRSKVYIDGHIVEWSMPDKLMQITCMLRHRTRMSLAANFATFKNGNIAYERRKVLAWIDDLKFEV